MSQSPETTPGGAGISFADGDSGPFIPSMAARAVVQRCLDGERPESGARSSHRDLELEDYEPLFKKHGIKTGIRQSYGYRPI